MHIGKRELKRQICVQADSMKAGPGAPLMTNPENRLAVLESF